jgi:hypothetical protein
MKNISKTLITILFLMMVSSCGSSLSRIRPDSPFDKRTVGENKFNPLSGGEDLDIITLKVPEARENISNGENPVIEARKPQTKQAGQYFSVQVYASKSNSDAEQFKNSIKSLFEDDVRIDYQAPYYRVCIGKTIGYENGEELLERVNAQGFPKAWLVRVRK